MFKEKVIGQNSIKVDALSKVTGRAQYPADLEMGNMLYGRLFQLDVAHARIIDININEAQKLPGVKVVLTGKDVPGLNGQGVLFADMPVLSADRIRSINDVVAIVVAEREDIAEEALTKIKVEYEELPAVFDAEEAMKEDAPKVHDNNNIIYHLKIRKGNVEDGFEKAAAVIEDIYTTQMVDHAFLQPEGCLAYLDNRGHLVIHVATQYIHWDRYEISRALNMPVHKIKVINTSVGGAFGGREDITLQIRTALLALKTGKPVKMVSDRKESFKIHSKRHPIKMYYKTGADAEGKLTALEARIIGDTGAYASWAPNIMRKAAIHATGPYNIPNVKVDSFAVYTNNPFAGAMRGFGAAQPPLAHESQMDRIAEKLGIHPFTIRWLNAMEEGSETATEQVLDTSVGLKECMRVTAAAAGWNLEELTGGGSND
ncbi:MAG: aldehyde oxidase [Desulfitibacter sp. BRH_c19]|nr:MAG: aldehyde oxidase [Desulfitibacter sp. BRH_c19]